MRQHKENERDCRAVVQQIVSKKVLQKVLTSTSYKRKEQVKGTQRKTVTFEDQDQKGEDLEQNLGQENLSGEKDVDGNWRHVTKKVCPGGESGVEEGVQGEKQDLEDEILFTDPEEEKCSVTDSSVDDDSRNSGIDTYSDRNSSTGSKLSELAIHTLLMETRA